MKKSKVLVLGYFGYQTDQLDGQTIKSRSIYNLLRSKQHEYFASVDFFDTQIFKLSKFNLLKMIGAILKCNILIYIPAQNNLRFGFPFIYFLTKLKGIKLHYIVVGGWLIEFLRNKPLHSKLLKKINGVYPQSNLLTDGLKKEYEFNNVRTLHNYRVHKYDAQINPVLDIIRIVFMARIHPMKGVKSIFRLDKEIRRRDLRNIVIDLYGPVFPSYQEEFSSHVKASETVNYKGILQPGEIYQTLNKYDLMVLPTKYFTEGFPGSILDAYIAGIPVIVSRWKHAEDFVENGKTGIIYEFNNEQDFFDSVFRLIDNPKEIFKMKKGALSKSDEYSAESAWNILKAGF